MKISFVLLFLLLPTFCYAELSFEQLNQLSDSPEQLHGHFVQKKYLSDLDATLTSSGKFSYLRNVEIKWETVEPIENVLVITSQSISSRQGEQQLTTFEADSNPVVAMISDIFFSVLTANWNQLENYFSLTGSEEGNNWKAVLTPVDESVMHVVDSIELTGSQFIEKLIFFEENGDHTTIVFNKLVQ